MDENKRKASRIYPVRKEPVEAEVRKHDFISMCRQKAENKVRGVIAAEGIAGERSSARTPR